MTIIEACLMKIELKEKIASIVWPSNSINPGNQARIDRYKVARELHDVYSEKLERVQYVINNAVNLI